MRRWSRFRSIRVYTAFQPVERLVIHQDADAIAIEQYRRLAAVLHQAQVDLGIKVVMVASAQPAEGKTLTAANLALTLSESYQRRVLLIDADFRRPALSRLFQLPNRSRAERGLEVDRRSGTSYYEPVRVAGPHPGRRRRFRSDGRTHIGTNAADPRASVGQFRLGHSGHSAGGAAARRPPARSDGRCRGAGHQRRFDSARPCPAMPSRRWAATRSSASCLNRVDRDGLTRLELLRVLPKQHAQRQKSGGDGRISRLPPSDEPAYEQRLRGAPFLLVAAEGVLIMTAIAVAAYVRLGDWMWTVMTEEHGIPKALLVAAVCQVCLYYADLYEVRRVADRRRAVRQHRAGARRRVLHPRRASTSGSPSR